MTYDDAVISLERFYQVNVSPMLSFYRGKGDDGRGD